MKKKNPTKPTPKKGLTEKQKIFLEIFQKSLGVIFHACKKAGIDRSTFYDWKKKNELFVEKVEEIEESAIDFVESKLFEKIQDGDTTSIIFLLKTKGRHRGYIQKAEIDNSGKIEIEFVKK